MGMAEIASQKGSKAAARILLDLAEGRRAEGNSCQRRVLVCDMNPREGDWAEACWQLQERWEAGETISMFAAE